LWVGSMILGGYFLGRSVPNIGQRIHYVIAAVVLLSVLPAIISIVRARRYTNGSKSPTRSRAVSDTEGK
jgi:membrane-associated protein